MSAAAAVETSGIAPELETLLRTLWGAVPGMRIVGEERLAPAVHRVRVAAGDRSWSVIARCRDAVMAARNRLVAERWLPAVRLSHAAPRLLGSAPAGGGNHVWQVHEDLGAVCIDETTPDPSSLQAAVDAIARVHAAFAEHPLLAECRLRGTDFGVHWYASNVRDALRALERARDVRARAPDGGSLVERLLALLGPLAASTEHRARELDELGGPETLLHGDLWPKNVVIARTGTGCVARLVDWDRVGVGPVSYDLSAFLSRLPGADRGWVLERYRVSMAARGWTLPTDRQLDALFATAELARLANRVIWPALALVVGDADPAWARGELAMLAEWIETERAT